MKKLNVFVLLVMVLVMSVSAVTINAAPMMPDLLEFMLNEDGTAYNNVTGDEILPSSADDQPYVVKDDMSGSYVLEVAPGTHKGYFVDTYATGEFVRRLMAYRNGTEGYEEAGSVTFETIIKVNDRPA